MIRLSDKAHTKTSSYDMRSFASPTTPTPAHRGDPREDPAYLRVGNVFTLSDMGINRSCNRSKLIRWEREGVIKLIKPGAIRDYGVKSIDAVWEKVTQ